LPGNAYGFWEHQVHGVRVIAHGGEWVGYQGLFALLPDQSVGIFLAHTGGTSAFRLDVGNATIARFFARPTTATRPATSTMGIDLSRFSGTYVWNRYNHTSFERALSLFAGWVLEVSASTHGLTIHNPASPNDHRLWLPVAPLLFQSEDGVDHVAFGTDAASDIDHIFLSVGDLPAAAERVPALFAPRTLLPIGILNFALLCSACVVLPLRHWRRTARPRGLERYADIMALAVSGSFVAFAVGLIIELGPPYFIQPAFGVPPSMLVVLAIPYFGAILLVGLFGAVGTLWLWRRGALWWRVYLTLLAFAGAQFALLLSYVNLLGP
jgi:hypothetical protein